MQILGIVIGVIALFVILAFGRGTIIGVPAFFLVLFTVYFHLVLREKGWRWRTAMGAAVATALAAILGWTL